MKLLPRSSALTLLTMHAVGAAAWLWFMPGGFPIAHSRFWTNRVGPIIVLTVALAAFVARLKRRTALFQVLALTIPFAWLGAAICGIVTFPISARIVSPLALIGAIVMTASLRPLPKRTIVNVTLWIGAIALGTMLPPLERAGAPRTVSSDIALTEPPADAVVREYVPSIPQRDDLVVYASSGQLGVSVGRVQVQVAPLLTFISRSPDRCWTILSPREQRMGPARELVAMRKSDEKRALDLWYRSDDLAHLLIDASADDRVTIDAQTRFPAPVYSHLNTFTEIAVVGHRKLRLGFSGAGGGAIDVTYADYPFGAPLRFAYFDAIGNRLRVVEATNAEKGPFRELASGPIRRGEPLTITLYDDDQPLAAITLHDFTRQASSELSPTAGYGVPANSIQFSLSSKSDRSAATILISLADTGIGRGYDTVGHAAGVYRNRVTIRHQ
jgi:hypothetical protein